MRLMSVNRLWNKAKHNAFTDLCEFKGRVFCCFREATNHISADGAIRILNLEANAKIEYSHCLQLAGVDLRDPKLSVTPDGKLLLIAYARHTDSNNKTRFGQSICWFSGDGCSWSSPIYFADKNWWLWRLRWHQGIAYGFAYNRQHQAIHLYSGDPRRTFQTLKTNALSLSQHSLGYPNESDLCFAHDGTAYAIVRRDADSCSAQLGIAKPPYKKWVWHDLATYIGGPCTLKINEKSAIIGGRLWRSSGPKTALWQLDLHNKKLAVVTELPSAGDTSYPGLVLTNNQLMMSYYSSHQHKSSIYLAQFSCP